MDQVTLGKIQDAVEAARQVAHKAGLDRCDVSDLDEAIEAADRQLESPHPNANTLTLYLNSLARSLITLPGTALPEARRACERIDEALRSAGLPATWEQ